MIQLYPSNWLYNAGVVGFLKILSNVKNSKRFFYFDDNDYVVFEDLDKIFNEEKSEISEIPFWHFFYVKEGEGILKNVSNSKGKKAKDVTFKINNNTIIEFDCNNFEQYLENNKQYENIIKFLFLYRNYTPTLFSKDKIYANFYPPGKIKDFNYFVDYFTKERIFKKSSNSKEIPCSFCGSKDYELSSLDLKFMQLLMPSYSGFPNSFWNNDNSGIDKICSFCQFLLIHHHLAFTKLSDGSEIFINAPSFKVMYELNKLVNELFGSGHKDSKQKREILAISIIEYTRRVQSTLANWTSMNIEIVIKQNEIIDFYILPYETVRLISDREIATLLSDIGEFYILNCVLNGKFSDLVEVAGVLTRIGIKEQNKSDTALINNLLRKKINKNNINRVSQKILKLYASIIDRRKKYARAGE